MKNITTALTSIIASFLFFLLFNKPLCHLVQNFESEKAYTILRNSLEILYFTSGIVLIWTIFINRKAYLLSKSESEENKRHKLRENAIQLCNNYIEIYHEEYRKLRETLDKDNRQFRNDCRYLLNRLDLLSLSFIEGHADSNIGKMFLGSLFIEQTKDLSQWINIEIETPKFANIYTSIYQLRQEWI